MFDWCILSPLHGKPVNGQPWATFERLSAFCGMSCTVLYCQVGISRPLLSGVKRAYILMSQNRKSSWLLSQKIVQNLTLTTVCFLSSTMVEMLLAFYINSDPATSIVSGQGNKVACSIVWNSSLKTGDKRQIRTGSVAYPTDTPHRMPLCHESQGGRFTAV